MFRIKTWEATVEGDVVRIAGPCLFTNEHVEFTVPAAEYEAYTEQGLYVQDAFPTTPAWQREFLLSSIGLNGWEKLKDHDDVGEAE